MAKDLANFDKNYAEWVQELKKRYLTQRLKAHSAVLNHCLEFYWSLGKGSNKYGTDFYKNLSLALQHELSEVKRLSFAKLKYMKYYYKLFKDEVLNRYQAVNYLMNSLWRHSRSIIDSGKRNAQKAFFFISKTIGKKLDAQLRSEKE